jgi:hypothetical protein
MQRVVRNYLIGFALIALLLLAVRLVNRWADSQQAAPSPAPGRTVHDTAAPGRLAAAGFWPGGGVGVPSGV